MKPIEIIFGTYNGLPFGSTDVEFEHAYQRSYKPFLTTLYKFPGVHAAIYYSGIVLSWLQEHHPEFLMLLNDMVKRSQIELLGGAFYEPILPLIPSSDRSGQIEMLTTYLRKRFGKRPRGIWIPELAWEPSLPTSLRNCGMEYTFLDEASFDAAGVPAKSRYQPVKTEDQGKAIEVYAVLSRLTPSTVVGSFTGNGNAIDPSQYLKRVTTGVPSDEDAVLVVLDQGEALGLWDNGYERIYGDGWLAGLFESLLNDKRLTTVLPRSVSQRSRRARRCYFGCSAAEALLQWWMPGAEAGTKETKQTLRKRSKALIPTGSFRQLLGRYPESTILYAKMMHVNILVNQIRGDRYRKRAAREELWKAQSGHPYWHGKIDGIYRNSIRKAAYSALIEAEKIAREQGVFKQHISKEDFDMDGLDEYLIRGNALNVYVDTVGGSIFELDHLPVSWNYLDTMARYEEPYHDTLLSGDVFDGAPRRGFTDRLEAHDLTMEEYLSGAEKESVRLFGKVYRVIEYKRDQLEVALAANCDDTLVVEKRYRLSEDELSLRYLLRNEGAVAIKKSFISELHLSFASNNEEFLQVRAHTVSGEVLTLRDIEGAEQVASFEARDLRNAVTITVTLGAPCALWSAPVITTWYSRSGPRVGYQCSLFAMRWPLELAPGQSIELDVRLAFHR